MQHNSLSFKGELKESNGDYEGAKKDFEGAQKSDKDNKKLKKRIQYLDALIKAKNHQFEVGREELNNYVGDYGRLLILLDDNKLKLIVKGMNQEFNLVPISKNKFALENSGMIQVEFIINEKGEATEIISHFLEGEQEDKRINVGNKNILEI